ncbi:MAG: YpmA family protein [Syntrophomonadaceae bacterium]|nr:YpmA family protein [Syntrophomonadaceae bacterium]
MSDDKGKLELIAFKSFPSNPELIYIIDFLNKSLKEKKIMFGLSKDKEKDEMIINIYEF